MFILSAAVQEGILGWGNGLDRGFPVATGKTGVWWFSEVHHGTTKNATQKV